MLKNKQYFLHGIYLLLFFQNGSMSIADLMSASSGTIFVQSGDGNELVSLQPHNGEGLTS